MFQIRCPVRVISQVLNFNHFGPPEYLTFPFWRVFKRKICFIKWNNYAYLHTSQKFSWHIPYKLHVECFPSKHSANFNYVDSKINKTYKTKTCMQPNKNVLLNIQFAFPTQMCGGSAEKITNAKHNTKHTSIRNECGNRGKNVSWKRICQTNELLTLQEEQYFFIFF